MSTPRYHLIRPVSEGGAGRVWLAEDLHAHGRRVALKRLRAGVDVAVLSREFDTLRRLSHPHVAKVLDFSRDDGEGHAFLVEEFVDGPDLARACAGLPVEARAHLLAQVLRGLEYVHARGVVHGDVKPANVLCAGAGSDLSARIIDFGLAARPGESGEGVGGTVAYLAPEVIREEPAGPSSDLYSFGVTAYEVLTGCGPFGVREPSALLRAHLEEIPTSPTEVVPELPPTLDRYLLSLLEKDPANRPGSAREALSGLGDALGLRWEAETAETLKGYLRSGRLHGRDLHLRRAHEMWQSVRTPRDAPADGEGHTQALHLLWWWGLPRSGHTRLLSEIGGDALIDGARVVHARAGELGPMGPARAWLRGLGVNLDPLAGARDRWEAIERAAKELCAASASGATAVLLTLDDAGAADELTLDLLRVLLDRVASAYVPGATMAAPRLAVLVAGDAPPDRLGGAHAECYDVQALAPLTCEELRGWLSSLVPSDSGLPADFVRGLHRLTEGLPGHVVTLLGALAERGHLLLRDGGLLVQRGALAAPLPVSVREALAERESGLPPEARTVLELLRVLGEAAPARLLAAIVSGAEGDGALDPARLAPALEHLVQRGLVGVDASTPAGSVPGAPADEARFRAEGAGGDIEPERRRALHTLVARSLAGLGGRQTVAGFGSEAVARHAREAAALGEVRLRALAHQAALVAAAEARELHASDDEARLLSWALELGADTDSGRPVALRLGELYQRLGRFSEAAAAYDSVRGDPGGHPDEVDRAILGLAAIEHARGEHSRAYEQAASIGEGRPRRAEALSQMARARLMMGRYEEALELCAAGLARQPDPGVESQLRHTRAVVYYYTEQPEQALPEFEASADACRAAGDPTGHATAVNGVGLVLHRKGDFAGALLAYERSLRIAQQCGDRKRVAAAAMNIGTVLHETGRAGEAAERYRESLRAAELLGDGPQVAKAASNLGNLLIYLNRLAEARYWLERSTREAERHEARLVVVYNEALLGKVFHREGAVEAARRHLLSAVSTLREMGNVGEAGELFIELGMVARTGGDTEGMEHFARTAAAQAEASGAEKQLAAVRLLQGEARRMAGDTEAAVPLLRSALVLADRHRLPDLGWMCEAGLGRCYREQGNAMEARARFHACSERIFAEAGGLSGRDRDVFLADPQRDSTLAECRLAQGETGALPAAAREGHEQLLRIMEINRRLVTERDLQRLLELILDSAIALTGAERGFVILRHDEGSGSEAGERDAGFEVRAARNIDQESLRKNLSKVSRSVTRDAIESGEPVITVDAGEDKRFSHVSSVHHLKLRSILCFPLRSHDGQVLGAIYLDNRFQASTFTEQDLAMIGAFGDQAAVAITDAWLRERNRRAQQELEAYHARIEALNAELRTRVSDQAARLRQIEDSLALQRSQLETRYRYDNIIGASLAMRRVFAVLDRVTDTSIPVLVEGESGTGKELVARAVHYNGSRRRDRPFVSVNCAALTETLLESELFGHFKGAFTGADRDHKGLFEVAHGGTLFLDEVADMSLAMQAKLLRALQEGEIWPVGSRKAVRVDVRIVAACNRDLTALVEQQLFRQDLYFRLNVVKVVLPPLRERGEDLVLLVQHFLSEYREKHGGPERRISRPALDLLLRYGWPGNVRELEATVMNACLFCDAAVLDETHFAHKAELLREAARPVVLSKDDRIPDGGGELIDLGDTTLAALEEKAILATLERTAGNKVEAARRLGITRQTLYNKLKTLGIEVRRNVRQA